MEGTGSVAEGVALGPQILVEKSEGVHANLRARVSPVGGLLW